MRKGKLAVFLLAALFVLGGCGNSGGNDTNQAQSSSETSAPTTSSVSEEQSASTQAQQQTDDNTSDQGEISRERALEIAMADAEVSSDNAREVKAERDEDDGIPIYDIEFETEYGDYDYEVAINGGKIVGADYEVEEEWARRQNGSAVSADDVKKIAQEKVPGVSEGDIKVWKESDDDDDEDRYEGKFRYDSIKYEFEVDASTGIIIDWNADLRDD